ncbi:MAG: hypothetical protein MUF34_11125 [Polyangiaceae bacterium]|jgi:cysteine-rich repeat protein|nr:hypothetical protein [Polyangiaceae bacterium]
MRLLLGLGFIGACLSATLGGCASGDAFPGDDCTPNDRKACSCDDGTKGWQLCLKDRSYEPCGCSGNNLNEGPPPAAVCGNGRVEPGELCDDGNQRNGDACSALCQRGSELEGRDSCANLRPLPLDVGDRLEGRQSVAEGDGSTAGSCGGDGSELVFAFAPRAAGTLALTVATEERSLDATLYVREDACGAETSEPANACKNDGGEGEGEELSLRVEEGKTYFVFVDARGGGEVTLAARLDEAVAGCAGEGEACDTGLDGDCGEGKLTCFENRYLVCRADRPGCG